MTLRFRSAAGESSIIDGSSTFSEVDLSPFRLQRDWVCSRLTVMAFVDAISINPNSNLVAQALDGHRVPVS